MNIRLVACAIALFLIPTVSAFGISSYPTFSNRMNSTEKSEEVPRIETKVQQEPSWAWFKTETHHHSTFSDGMSDPYVVGQSARDYGYNVLFLTDHDNMPFVSSISYDDELPSHELYQELLSGDIYENTTELASTPVKKGNYSLHFALNTSEPSSIGYTLARGTLGILYLHGDGELFLDFSIFPANVSEHACFSASVMMVGYTCANGTIETDGGLILSFAIGEVFGNGTGYIPNMGGYISREIQLPYVRGTWNDFSINIASTLANLGVSISNYSSVIPLAISVTSSNSQRAEICLDAFSLHGDNPKSPAECFAYRNSILSSFCDDEFKMYAAVEFSRFDHVNYFVYNFTSPAGYIDSSQINGTSEVVAWCHAQGYPCQLNHPAFLPSVPSDIIRNNGYGADLMETRFEGEISVWDTLLCKGVNIVGVWSTDSHTTIAINVNAGYDYSTWVYSRSIKLEDILNSLFEGKVFMSKTELNGTLIFNTLPSNEPHSLRQVNYVDSNAGATLYVRADGLQNGWKACWIRNGTYFFNETVTSPSYEALKNYLLPDDANYFRIEIRDANDQIVMMSEPIVFAKIRKVHNLDTGLNYTTIQGAINDPETLYGHSIFVEKGTYFEHLVVNKTLSLFGEDEQATIIDGNLTGTVLMVNASNVRVAGFTVRNSGTWPEDGILVFSNNNTICDNIVTSNHYGMALWACSDNHVFHNTIVSNQEGIWLGWSSDNALYENTVKENLQYGVSLLESSNNSFFHNGFLNNAQQWYTSTDCTNLLDDGYVSGGNYWSGYNGTDLNHDGIGDTHYAVDPNNNDRYPLMGTFSDFNATPEQHVQTVCNSTVSDFHFNGTAISFNVSGQNETAGFCRICIPKALMNSTYEVFVNGTEVQHSELIYSNATHAFLYFNYTHSTQPVTIIPEFPSILAMPLFILATLLADIVWKRKYRVDSV